MEWVLESQFANGLKMKIQAEVSKLKPLWPKRSFILSKPMVWRAIISATFLIANDANARIVTEVFIRRDSIRGNYLSKTT